MESQPQRPARALLERTRGYPTLDHSLKTLAGVAPMARPAPEAASADEPLDEPQRKLAASLMRVDHVGEVCAQALYRARP